MNQQTITYSPETKTITDIVNLHEDGHLNLEPGFQRQSVWQPKDRAKLIESVLRNYPIPAIFLHRRQDAGQIVYDVIDGKQRIESILMFMGEMRGRYSLATQLPGSETVEVVSWKSLGRQKLQHLLTGYKIPVIEVDGAPADVIDLFVRINSTGKALTPQEKRHAKYFDSDFLREADRLARRFEPYFLEMGILGKGQIARMKHIELMCELMLSAHQSDVINRKAVLDRVMATKSFTPAQTRKAVKKATTALNRVKRMFPKLYTSRLRQVTDFYSLCVLVLKLEAEGLILTDRHRNRLAWDLLSAFSTDVDKVRENQRKAIGIKPHQELYRDYLLTVSQMSDDVNQRRKRENILRAVIASLFARKDEKRLFTSEQRRILWNTAKDHQCTGCGAELTWANFTIDHVDPHSKGGRSRLENAALMCRACNSSKGHRRQKRRKRGPR